MLNTLPVSCTIRNSLQYHFVSMLPPDFVGHVCNCMAARTAHWLCNYCSFRVLLSYSYIFQETCSAWHIIHIIIYHIIYMYVYICIYAYIQTYIRGPTHLSHAVCWGDCSCSVPLYCLCFSFAWAILHIVFCSRTCCVVVLVWPRASDTHHCHE